MDDLRDLEPLHFDALREVANIGAGHAATALSQMIDRTIMIKVPEVSVTPLEDVPGIIGDPGEVSAAVLMQMIQQMLKEISIIWSLVPLAINLVLVGG